MFKFVFISILFCLMIHTIGISQSSAVQPGLSPGPFHPASQDKETWQRLNLWLSSTYILVVKEGQVDLDSCLFYASRSLGLSRFSILAEGLDDPGLFEQSSWIDQQNPGKANQLLSQVKGKKHLELLILMGAYYAFQPQRNYSYRDSVEYFLTRAVDESRAIKEERLGRQALCLLGKIYVQSNDFKQGDSIFKRVIHECEFSDDKRTAARALAYRGIFTPPSPTTVQNKINDIQKAAEYYRQLNDKEGEINMLTDLGYVFLILSQSQPANDVFLKALQLEEAIHYPYTQYNTDALTVVNMYEGKFGETLKNTIQTIKTAENSRDSIGWAYFYARLCVLYTMEGGKDKERAYWRQKALDRFIIDRNPALFNILIDQIESMNERGLDKEALDLVTSISKKIPPQSFTDRFFYEMALATCYTDLRQFETAEMHLSNADSMETKAESIRGPLRRALIYKQYGNIYFEQAQYHKAKLYLEKYFLTNSRGTQHLGANLAVYRRLIDIDSAIGDNAAAVAHYKKYTQLLDSNFRVSSTRQAEELQVIYQTEEKENQITLLNQETKLEQANLKQATQARNMTIAGIIGVLMIAGLLYRQNRLKQKNNQEITHKNGQLQHFLTEKEWLLKEIHHRVKNNLQIVMSLLNSQSAYIDNELALTAIHDSQHRVHAMSLIHQKLYNSENLASIDMSVYIYELATYLADSFNTGQRIRFEYDIEPVEMDVSQAVPLGLILNEAITNAIKYAFPDGRKGIIAIALSLIESGQCRLIISDNGIGIPFDFKNRKTGSLGMSLMEGLSEDLAGNLSVENRQGTTIGLSFEYEPGVKKSDDLTKSFALNN